MRRWSLEKVSVWPLIQTDDLGSPRFWSYTTVRFRIPAAQLVEFILCECPPRFTIAGRRLFKHFLLDEERGFVPFQVYSQEQPKYNNHPEFAQHFECPTENRTFRSQKSK
jgi:hypothetical protein